MTTAARPPLSKEEAEERYGEGEVQQCPQCEGWYSKHSPPWACFACAVGMDFPEA